MLPNLLNPSKLLWENRKMAWKYIHNRSEYGKSSLNILIKVIEKFCDFKLNDIWWNQFYHNLIDINEYIPIIANQCYTRQHWTEWCYSRICCTFKIQDGVLM